jgi:hypothetical protein
LSMQPLRRWGCPGWLFAVTLGLHLGVVVGLLGVLLSLGALATLIFGEMPASSAYLRELRHQSPTVCAAHQLVCLPGRAKPPRIGSAHGRRTAAVLESDGDA